jgi:hypothetical protein
MSDSQTGPSRDVERNVTLQLDNFAWEAIEQECAKLGVSAEDLISFSVLYYLADLDSGRVARRILGPSYPAAQPPVI